MGVFQHNRTAWDRKVEQGDRWTVPVDAEAMAEARAGQWAILLTPVRPVPREWFPNLPGCDVLCLASGGGQQGPLLAAAGANVTVLDASPRQLQQDRIVADREGLAIETIEGDMADQSVFAANSFDLIVHPCSNCFVPQIRPVWREVFRVMRHGGRMLAGFVNLVRYLFDDERTYSGSLEVKYAIPFSDLTDLDEAQREAIVDRAEPLEFGHTLEDQIGGQTDAGFALTGFYEDRFPAGADDPISRHMATFIATCAVKP